MTEIADELKSAIIKERVRSRRLKVLLYVMFTFFVIFIAGFLGIYTSINLGRISVLDMMLTLMPQEGLENQTNILVVGIDDTKDSKRSDTLMIVHVDSAKSRVGVMSIPRDSRVNVPGHGMTKINHAFAYGGIELLQKTIEDFLQIPINKYVVINLNGVVNIIDQLGGITIDIDKRMYYVDNAGDLYIDIQPGEQTLTGEQAMGYIRYRKDPAGDIGRIQRQQNFMKAVADKIIKSGKIFQAPQMFAEISKNFTTNMSTKQLVTLAFRMRNIFLHNRIDVETVPGAVVLLEGVSYWRPDIPMTLKQMDRVIHGFEYSEEEDQKPVIENKELGSATALTTREIKKIVPTLKEVEEDKILPEAMQLSVEVLNGCGVANIAQSVARRLKEKDIKVPWVGNAAHFDYENTIIVDWKGLTREVMYLATSLHIDPKNIVTYYKPDKKLDVTLVLGKDWTEIEKQLR